ncbi:MAG TPA: hypothetical protein VN886_20410, partial [Acidimicrobiales bacterium]|nr:hypothetical protein [Acidimicrobiales bacterium]
TVVNNQTVTAPDITGGSATISSGAGTNQLTLSANATATTLEDVRIATTTKLSQGDGVPIGVPIRIDGVNTGSGTQQIFATFADVGGTGCGSSQFGNFNQNDIAQDPNPVTRVSDNASTRDLLENNSDQIDQFAATDFPGDAVDQSIEAATSIYVISFGVQKGTPTDANVNIDSTGAVPVVGNSNVTSYGGNLLALDGVFATASTEVANTFPTARTLWNIYRTDTVRASTAGLLNWMCDSNTNFNKGTDNSTQQNFDTELGNLISSVYFFPRNTDTTQPPATATPLDGVPAPNNTCAASLNVNTTQGSNTVTLTSGGAFPVDIVNQGQLPGSVSGFQANSVIVSDPQFASGTYVVSGASTETYNSGTSTWNYVPSLTLTLSQPAAATATGVATVFYGVPAVTSVGSPNT